MKNFIRFIRFILLSSFLYFFSFLSAQSEEIPQSIVKVFSYTQVFNPRTPWNMQFFSDGSGSGFVIEDNVLLTNAHVVANAKYLEVKKPDNPKSYLAKVKYISHACDLAVLEVDDKSFYDHITPLKLGNLPELNTEVKTIGFPMGGEKISITTGIVSRIEKILYTHSSIDEHLAIQTDSAINPGNSGGPALQGGVVIGMAFQGIPSGEGLGFLIPTSLIKSFIEDTKDGKVDGIPEMGAFFNLLPPNMKPFLDLSPETNGVLITGTHPLSPANKILKKNDVITEINERPIDDDATISMDGLRVPFYEVLERMQYGNSVHLKWYRNKKLMETHLKLVPFKRALDSGCSYPMMPDYYIYGGLTFVKLTGDYMRNFGKEWYKEIPPLYRLLYHYDAVVNKEPNRDCYLVLSEILEHPQNLQAKPYKDQVLESINGKSILDFNDLIKAFETPSLFLELRFISNPVPLILETGLIYPASQDILNQYRVSKAFHSSTQDLQ